MEQDDNNDDTNKNNKAAILKYKLGSIKNRNIEVTNLEIEYYQNKMPGSMIYKSTILDSYCGYGQLQNRRINRWYL